MIAEGLTADDVDSNPSRLSGFVWTFAKNEFIATWPVGLSPYHTYAGSTVRLPVRSSAPAGRR